MSNVIGITMGDPCGVGPEISVRALAGMSPEERQTTRIYGNLLTLEAARSALGIDVDLAPHVVDLPIEGAPLPWGQLNPVAGDAAFRFIEKAVRDAEAGIIGCIVTAPINKEALNLAGHHYDGHTGMLRSLTGSNAAYMLLASERLKVIHVSTHVSLQEAIRRSTTDRSRRHQSALRRERPLRHRGRRSDRASGQGCTGRGHRRLWSDLRRHGFPPGLFRRLRSGRGAIS